MDQGSLSAARIQRVGAMVIGLGAAWLFLLAIPVFADGGPHVATVNSGIGTYTGVNTAGVLTSDNCAGCHRTHTAQAYDITLAAVPALCLTCHGGAALGATTNVLDGVQYTAAAAGTFGGTGTILGALRSGGFVNARIDTSDPSRIRFGSGDHDFKGKVPVLSAGGPVTSRHMGTTAVALKTVWGSGALGVATTAGDTMTLNCTSCHNPHGNGKYRILNPIPTTDEAGPGTWTAPSAGVSVVDGPLPTGAGLGQNTRNYTVIQNAPLPGGVNTLLTVADVLAMPGYSPTAGDYWRRTVPWTSNAGQDSPVGATLPTFQRQISLWCAQCHTRYLAGGGSAKSSTYDPIYNYQHTTSLTPECTQCHVAHGSNALMPGTYSSTQLFPGQASGATPYQTITGVADSRLLKVDNRGTCQMCHDPSGSITVGTYSGPLPTPGTP